MYLSDKNRTFNNDEQVDLREKLTKRAEIKAENNKPICSIGDPAIMNPESPSITPAR